MTPDQWADHLDSIAGPVLRGTPLESGSTGVRGAARDFIDRFTDELGHRRAVDRPLLHHLLGVDLPGPVPPDASLDVELWWGLHHDSDPCDGLAPPPGPLLGEAEFSRGAIEATTETELAALHALSHHARGSNSEDLKSRVLDAARWHVDTLQPDNGTNHPWAVHVFIQLSESDPAYAAGAILHAEGLLHNAMVRSGRPDRFSACVLLDAARALRTLGGSASAATG